MTLSSMLVSRDWPEVSVLECILGSLHIGVDVEPEPVRARAKLAKSKVDALIVDSDLDGSTTFLRSLSNGLKSVPLVILRTCNARNRAQTSDATFVFEKPISVEQAVHTLSAARNMILESRLRYHRHNLHLPVALRCGDKRRLKAQILNLSQGGAGVHLQNPLQLSGPIGLGFSLPGSRVPLNVEGEVAWMDEHGNAGIRFLEMGSRAKKHLQVWLEQQYLTH